MPLGKVSILDKWNSFWPENSNRKKLDLKREKNMTPPELCKQSSKEKLDCSWIVSLGLVISLMFILSFVPYALAATEKDGIALEVTDGLIDLQADNVSLRRSCDC